MLIVSQRGGGCEESIEHFSVLCRQQRRSRKSSILALQRRRFADLENHAFCAINRPEAQEMAVVSVKARRRGGEN